MNAEIHIYIFLWERGTKSMYFFHFSVSYINHTTRHSFLIKLTEQYAKLLPTKLHIWFSTVYDLSLNGLQETLEI